MRHGGSRYELYCMLGCMEAGSRAVLDGSVPAIPLVCSSVTFNHIGSDSGLKV